LADFNNLTKCMRRRRQSKAERMPRPRRLPRGIRVARTDGLSDLLLLRIDLPIGLD
jgi:hypothetical protein